MATDASPSPQYFEQAVDVGLGPTPAFAANGVGMLTRTVSNDEVVTAVPASRRKRRKRPNPRPPGLPPIVETLRKATEWRRQLDAGEVPNQAAIARREGITRARVTQILGLLRLAPSIRESISMLPDSCRRASVSEKMLRHIAQLNNSEEQAHTLAMWTGKFNVIHFG